MEKFGKLSDRFEEDDHALKNLESTEAQAAPANPIFGMKPKPKISIGSNIKFLLLLVKGFLM